MRNWVYSHNYRLAVYNCRIYFTEAAFGQPLLLFEEVESLESGFKFRDPCQIQ